MNEDDLWEGAVVAAEVFEQKERSSSSKKRAPAAVAQAAAIEITPMELTQEDICVLCNSAWAKAEKYGKFSTSPPREDDDVGKSRMSQQEREQVMLICEECHGSFHMVCVGCFTVPDGDWYCRFCEINLRNEQL